MDDKVFDRYPPKTGKKGYGDKTAGRTRTTPGTARTVGEYEDVAHLQPSDGSKQSRRP